MLWQEWELIDQVVKEIWLKKQKDKRCAQRGFNNIISTQASSITVLSFYIVIYLSISLKWESSMLPD